MSGQSLNNSLPNTVDQEALIRATGTENRESNDLHYAVNRRVVGLAAETLAEADSTT